jgi:hypothetical protein
MTDEGQGWRLMDLAEFVSLEDSVPSIAPTEGLSGRTQVKPQTASPPCTARTRLLATRSP